MNLSSLRTRIVAPLSAFMVVLVSINTFHAGGREAEQTVQSLRETNRALESLGGAAHDLQQEIAHFRVS